VNRSTGPAGQGAGAHRPSPNLVLSDGEEGDQPEQLIGGPDDTIEAGLPQAQIHQEVNLMLVVEMRDLLFDRGAYHDDSCAGGGLDDGILGMTLDQDMPHRH